MTLPRALSGCIVGLALTTPAASAQSTPPAGAGRVCTEIGCESGVFLDAEPYLAAHPAVRSIRVCALGRCRSIGRVDHAFAGPPLVLPVAREQNVKITVTAYDANRRVVLRRALTTGLRRAQPNGPHCQPICFQADVRLSGNATLSRSQG